MILSSLIISSYYHEIIELKLNVLIIFIHETKKAYHQFHVEPWVCHILELHQ